MLRSHIHMIQLLLAWAMQAHISMQKLLGGSVLWATDPRALPQIHLLSPPCLDQTSRPRPSWHQY